MYSKNIESFLDFLRNAQQEYNIAAADEKESNDETQDILHALELNENSYHEFARLSKSLRAVRKKRRKAKDTQAQLRFVIDWIDENSKVINELEKLLGNVRKAERSVTLLRTYTPRTEVVEKAVGRREE